MNILFKHTAKCFVHSASRMTCFTGHIFSEINVWPVQLFLIVNHRSNLHAPQDQLQHIAALWSGTICCFKSGILGNLGVVTLSQGEKSSSILGVAKSSTPLSVWTHKVTPACFAAWHCLTLLDIALRVLIQNRKDKHHTLANCWYFFENQDICERAQTESTSVMEEAGSNDRSLQVCTADASKKTSAIARVTKSTASNSFKATDTWTFFNLFMSSAETKSQILSLQKHNICEVCKCLHDLRDLNPRQTTPLFPDSAADNSFSASVHEIVWEQAPGDGCKIIKILNTHVWIMKFWCGTASWKLIWYLVGYRPCPILDLSKKTWGSEIGTEHLETPWKYSASAKEWPHSGGVISGFCAAFLPIVL